MLKFIGKITNLGGICMKKRLALLLILSLVLLLTACGRETPETAINNAMQAIVNGDMETVQTYFAGDVPSALDDETSDESSDLPDGYYDMLMQNLTYSITEVVDNGDDTATATIEMTNTDFGVAMGSVMSRALSELIGYAFLPEDQQLSDEQLEELYMQWLLEEYSSEDAISITNTATVNMTYQDGGWKIEASDEFFDALLGGMLSAVENM